MQNKSFEIDVTIIATVRPDVLEKTLSSLIAMCPDIADARAVLNVDCVPVNTPDKFGNVYLMTKKYLPVKFMRAAWQPSFSRAVISAWQMTTAEYVFHLEDDWEFIKPIDLGKCIDMIDSGEADYIRFSKRPVPISEEANKIALLPGLWKGETVRGLARYMSAAYDPEKQLRHGFNEGIDSLLPKKIYDYSLTAGGIVCHDNGRKWRLQRGLEKWDKNTPGDITWRTNQS